MSTSYTQWEHRRLQELHAKQQHHQLTPEEIAECNRLERRREAEWFLDGIYYGAMACDLNIERGFDDVYDGLCLVTRAADAAERVQGLKLGLAAALNEPDALIAAVRVLAQNLDR